MSINRYNNEISLFVKTAKAKYINKIIALRVFATGWAIKVHPIAEAALTQLVECLAVNQNVVGSSPASGVKFPWFL